MLVLQPTQKQGERFSGSEVVVFAVWYGQLWRCPGHDPVMPTALIPMNNYCQVSGEITCRSSHFQESGLRK